MERCPGCDAPSPTLPPCPSSEQPPRPPPRPFLFLLHISLTPYSQAPPPARAGAAPPLPGLHRPPLSAPLARDNVMGEIGHSSSSLGVSSIPPFSGLRPPQPIPAASRSIGSGLAKLLGHGKRLGPHPSFPGCLHPSSSGACIPPSRGARIPSLLGSCIPRFPGCLHPFSLGAASPISRGSPASPRGHSRFSRPGPPPAEAALPTRPRRAWVSARKRTPTMVSCRLWRRLCDPQPQRPCDYSARFYKAPSKVG